MCRPPTAPLKPQFCFASFFGFIWDGVLEISLIITDYYYWSLYAPALSIHFNQKTFAQISIYCTHQTDPPHPCSWTSVSTDSAGKMIGRKERVPPWALRPTSLSYVPASFRSNKRTQFVSFDCSWHVTSWMHVYQCIFGSFCFGIYTSWYESCYIHILKQPLEIKSKMKSGQLGEVCVWGGVGEGICTHMYLCFLAEKDKLKQSVRLLYASQKYKHSA